MYVGTCLGPENAATQGKDNLHLVLLQVQHLCTLHTLPT